MAIFIVELTEAQLNNLMTFLSRVEMKGEEAYAYVALIQSLKSARVSAPKDTTD
jgi:hypothetical protein